MATVLVRFVDDESRELVHRLRNYGEDVFYHLPDAERGMGQVSMDEVDAATSEFSVRGVAQSKVRRLRQWLEEEAARQNLRVSTEVD